MEPATIVVAVNELFQVSSQVFQILLLVGVDLLLFERFHKTLAGGIGEGRQLHRMTTMAIPLLKSSTHTIR